MTKDKVSREDYFAMLVARRMIVEANAKGYSQAALARAIGKHASELSDYKSGKHAMPVSMVVRVAEAIGVSPRTIVQRAHAQLIDELGAPPATPTQFAGTAPSRTSALPTAATRARVKRPSKGTRGSSSG